MISPPQVFDKHLLRARRRRARRGVPATFLLERAVEELDARLSGTNRDFAAALDLGSPTSVVAEALARRYPQARIVRLALDSEALEGAKLPAAIGDEEHAPFAPESFDLVVSLLVFQHTNDLPGAFAQIRRTLKPDGLFLACLVGGRSLAELRTALAEAELETTGGASPRVSPFVDLRDLGGLLQRAGFALPVADVESFVVRYADLFGLMGDLRAMGATNSLVERSRAPSSRRFWLRAAQIYAERFGDADGRVRASFELVWLSGWAPHESQQKPLKPGSARMRLADALGVKEGKL